jgi:glutaredoxin
MSDERPPTAAGQALIEWIAGGAIGDPRGFIFAVQAEERERLIPVFSRVLRHQAQRNHEYAPDSCDPCNDARDLLEAAAVQRSTAEVERLRAVERAARMHVAWEYRERGAPRFTLSNLRAALAEPDHDDGPVK